jgi:hypothetical protein
VPVKKSKPKHRKVVIAPAAPLEVAAKPGIAFRSPIPFLERHARALVLALVIIGSARIVLTYSVFSHTVDEPGHIAAGIELLTRGVYRFDPQHPTLTRIAVGLGPALIGVSPPSPKQPGDGWMFSEGRRILYGSNKYEEALVLARLGILPFFWAACFVVYLWGKRYFGAATGVVSVFLLSFFPPLLGHAGLATTDMGCTAMLGAVFLAGCVLLEEPSARHAAVFGLCGGLAVLSKFSVLVYFPASAAVALLWYTAVERPSLRRLAQQTKALAPLLGLSTVIASLIVWAGYRFSFAHGVPAPELWSGVREVAEHNAQGHPTYLLGEISRLGKWYFFPVAIAVKTPIPFLVLACAGVWMAVRKPRNSRAWMPVAYAAGILAVAMSSHINIGLRHVLPIYIGLAVLGAVAVTHAWNTAIRSQWIPAAVALLLLWLTASSVASHPDYLTYFNVVAGNQPEKFLVDSDVDWGQDVTRLGLRLQALGAREVTFIAGDEYDFTRHPGFEGIKVYESMSRALPNAGWNAIAMRALKQNRLGLFNTLPQVTLWPDLVAPRERVGKSILLWYFPPGSTVPELPFGPVHDPALGGK